MKRPQAHELLHIARLTLLQELLPALPADKRYLTLMVASAMAIAARECQAASDADALEQEQLHALLDNCPLSLADARQGLAAAIREGRFDAGDERGRLVGALQHITLAQLAISNPKALP
ncbi:DUF6285 domain-containing protein [Pseudomonas sp. GD03860]|uniref:DUF6285 domain-containing protein n=1 Tax=Pseudomonas TaxID=286 RepID=UPI0023637819|nr:MULTISPECIES: DUF6285 domain-containing protein [Pseudomonas]MDD2056491.1 DUF6285 domain-containing protein [Pseudomonas putida]MDH0640479.1 DUF6285 domain-containing protein [Pseudomonas sp. GD03860]